MGCRSRARSVAGGILMVAPFRHERLRRSPDRAVHTSTMPGPAAKPPARRRPAIGNTIQGFAYPLLRAGPFFENTTPWGYDPYRVHLSGGLEVVAVRPARSRQHSPRDRIPRLGVAKRLCRMGVAWHAYRSHGEDDARSTKPVGLRITPSAASSTNSKPRDTGNSRASASSGSLTPSALRRS